MKLQSELVGGKVPTPPGGVGSAVVGVMVGTGVGSEVVGVIVGTGDGKGVGK